MWLKRLVRMLSISESLIKKQNKTSKISMKGNENIMQKNAIIKNFFFAIVSNMKSSLNSFLVIQFSKKSKKGVH